MLTHATESGPRQQGWSALSQSAPRGAAGPAPYSTEGPEEHFVHRYVSGSRRWQACTPCQLVTQCGRISPKWRARGPILRNLAFGRFAYRLLTRHHISRSQRGSVKKIRISGAPGNTHDRQPPVAAAGRQARPSAAQQSQLVRAGRGRWVGAGGAGIRTSGRCPAAVPPAARQVAGGGALPSCNTRRTHLPLRPRSNPAAPPSYPPRCLR